MRRTPSQSRRRSDRRLHHPRSAHRVGRVLIVTGSVGAGHDGAAHELAARLRHSGAHVDVRDYLEALPRAARHLLRDGYTLSVGKAPAIFEWLFRGIEANAFIRGCVLAFCRMSEGTVSGWLARGHYDLVVSTYPLASQTLGRFRAGGRLAAPVVTYLTDPATHRSWIHPAVDIHMTVTAAAAVQGSREYGTVMQVGGPLVPEVFRTPPAPGLRAAVRDDLGLAQDVPVALVVAGSLGLGDVPGTVKDVLSCGVSALVLCGRNEALRRSLSDLPGCVALGWRDDVPHLMGACDLLVHNAGGLSFTEAYVAGLPAVSYRCIPGHGLANARVLDDAGLAPWARNRAQLVRAVQLQITAGRTAPTHPDPAAQLRQMLANRPLAAARAGAAA